MAIDSSTLVKILDDAITNGMDSAIQKYGAGLDGTQIEDLKALTPEQMKAALDNLLAASGNLRRLLWFDNNNNNS